jgi:ABC-type Fe3+-hydroxamate transport system substrate-binding protein
MAATSSEGSIREAPRIISLVPSVTELVAALGLRSRLVGRTRFCIHPSAALVDVPIVGGTKDVRVERVRALAPTHVIVNVDENRRETVDALNEFVPHVIVTHPTCVRDNRALIDQLAAAFMNEPGVDGRARALGDEFEAELATTLAHAWTPHDVLYLIWRDPWMTIARDTYISSMLDTVGWHTLPALQGGTAGASRYPRVDAGAAWLDGVERILLSSEPYPFAQRDVTAARQLAPRATVGLIDGELVSWYGPRAAAGLRYLRQLAALG